jgi:2-polyprenyl-6-methoxyphenol hydroxylase-like FAD-dependent oxidoreductase
VTREFETHVTAADVHAGTLTVESKSGTSTRTFDFLVGADGAGSVVRKAMVEQVRGFTVATGSYPNWCTMIELDRVEGALDPNYIHGLAARPFCVAGAIKGEDGGPPRWFCAIGTKSKQTFASTNEARRYFHERAPRVLELTSDDKLAAYASRPCYHIGQTLRCSQLHGGKAVLLGDAAEAFPPIGQGVNAAMESAMTLDVCIGEASPDRLSEAASAYSGRWKPEVDAVAWMSLRSLFENRYHMMRSMLARKLGVNMFDDAKSDTIPWSEVKRKAHRIWPFWA